jgi:uncharacterized membrane protein YidH (DUF202 family)
VSEPRPGLAVERTVLAWTRTWLAVGACGLLLFRMSIGSAGRVAAALGVGAVALVVITVTGRRRAALLRVVAATPRHLPVATRAVAVTAATVTLLGLATAVLVAVS